VKRAIGERVKASGVFVCGRALTTGAIPMGAPGWPELAAKVAST
jgi:hypothetical protein